MITAGIEYLEAGEGPTVLFLHGIGSDAQSFADLIGALPGFRGIAWSMPGYGASAPRDLTFANLSAALDELITALDLGPVHLVGHSIGGMIALEHALQTPDQVDSLTLIGTTPAFGGRDDSFKHAFLKARLAPLEAGLSMVQMGAEAAPVLLGTHPAPGVLEAVADAMGRVPEATWRGILECLVTFNRRDDLAKITQPCCLIAGSHDQNAPAKTMARMAEALPDAEYSELQGIGHMIPQETPQEVARIITAFLEDLI